MKALTVSILVLGALMFFTLSAHANEMPAHKLTMSSDKLDPVVFWGDCLSGRHADCRCPGTGTSVPPRREISA